jgi:Glycosyl hydrolase family 12
VRLTRLKVIIGSVAATGILAGTLATVASASGTGNPTTLYGCLRTGGHGFSKGTVFDVSATTRPTCPAGSLGISWQGSVYSSPGSGSSPSSSPSSSPTSPSPSATTPSASPTTSSASPSPTGGSSAWFTAGGTVPNGNLRLDYRDNVWSGDAAAVGYTFTDLSSSPTHSTDGNFSTKLNAKPSNGEVVAGPDLQGVAYSAIPASLKSSFAVTPPANNTGLDYEYNYDIWLTTAAKAKAFDWSSDLELMIWTYTVRQTPAGSKVGTLPDGSAVWVAGNNVDGTVSIVLPQNQTSGTVDISALVSELKAKGYVTSADNGILDVEYGIECPYGGGNTFSVTQFSVTGTPNPATTGSWWVGAQ